MRRIGRLSGVTCALALLAGSVLATSHQAQAEAPAGTYDAMAEAPYWLRYDRPVEYGVAYEQALVPMRDGVLMRCTKASPTLGGFLAPAARPVVVANYFAYRALQPAMSPLTDMLVQRGYVTLTCSPRGSGGTPGLWKPFEAQEAQDNYDLIEWAGVQPWSNGRVGQTGISYGGISTYKAVATNPPHLKAAVPIVAYSDVYREMVYPGGTRGTVLRWWPGFTDLSSLPEQTPDNAALNAPEYLGFENRAQAHPYYDAYWKRLAVDTKAVDKSNIPILGIGGWNDLFPEGMVRNHLAAQDQSTLLMLPGAHVDMVPGLPDFAPAQHAILAFFDRLLMKRPGAPKPAAKFTSWQLPKTGGGWVERARFPTGKGTTLSLAGGAADGSTSEFRLVVDPFDSGCGCAEHGVFGSTDTANNDQRVRDQNRIRFDGGPVSGDTVIVGTPVAHLRAAISALDANIVVRLQDVGPDGTSTVITTGWLKASHRLGHERAAPLIPGQTYDYTVELWPTDWRIRTGHFVRITVSGGDLQMIEPTSPVGSTISIFAGQGGSTIDIPFG